MASQATAARPLLHDFDGIADPETALRRSFSTRSLRSLEEGSESHSVDEKLRPEVGFWRRIRMSVRRRNGAGRDRSVGRMKVSTEGKQGSKISRLTKGLFMVPLVILVFFGIVHILNVFLDFVPIFRDDPAASSLAWSLPDIPDSELSSHLFDITRDVTPIACHSHNDYWRRVPLYDALRWGCTSVEADVWLFDEELYVGHDTHALKDDKTFRSMYIDPLTKMLDHKNEASRFEIPSNVKIGLFDTAPAQTLILLVDFKNDGHAIFPVVSQHLTALREKNYLTYYDGESIVPGAITVVATGNAPFDLITANATYRDIFFDAPLDRLYIDSNPHSPSNPPPAGPLPRDGGQGTVGISPTSHFDSTNSFYASTNFGASIGWLWFGHISEAQRSLIRGQIRGAHEHGLKARYWNTPEWPVGLRNKVWKLLVEKGVDYLNGDDLKGMVRGDWRGRGHGGWLG